MKIHYEKSQALRPITWADVEVGQAAELLNERDTYLKAFTSGVGILLSEKYDHRPSIRTEIASDCLINAIFDVDLTLTRVRKD